MRIIDADKLKKCVLKWLPKDPCGREEKEMPFETDICVSMLMEIEEQPTIQLEPRWIPVTERLPDNSRNVLITHRGGVSMAWYNGLYFEKGASTHHQKIKTVTAWCELPEPYQKGGAE